MSKRRERNGLKEEEKQADRGKCVGEKEKKWKMGEKREEEGGQ